MIMIFLIIMPFFKIFGGRILEYSHLLIQEITVTLTSFLIFQHRRTRYGQRAIQNARWFIIR